MDPRHADPDYKNSGEKAPPAVVPMLCWIMVTVLLGVIGFAQTERVGMYPQKEVIRTGEANITSCRPDLLTFGTMQTCTADIVWEPKEAWQNSYPAELDEAAPYQIRSRSAVDGVVAVESHPHRVRELYYREMIIPAGQPSGTGGQWYVVLLGVPLVIAVVLLRVWTLPWIRRRNARANSGSAGDISGSVRP